MKHLPVTALLVAGGLLCGCEGTGWSHGECVGPLVVQLQAYGARVTTTNGLPQVRAVWRMQTDAKGFRWLIYGVAYDEVERAVQAAFGHQGQTYGSHGGARGCLFRAVDIGVGLHLMDKSDHVEVVCLRGMTNWPWFVGR